MSSIDQRVVEMKFDNSQFEQGAHKTIGTLDSLNKGLKLEGATKGLNDVANASKNLPGHVGGIGTAVQTVATKFSAMSALAVGALASVGFKAATVGAGLVKSLSLEPVMAGFKEYELNLNSIQTILANTKVSGATLKDVNAALDELNRYSDQTKYNFGEMAKNIGTFTAAGVALGPATAAIKGIANVAAMSGASSQQASGAMYQLSQAIASGKVSLMDWQSVVTANMASTTFQRSLAETAVAMGKLPTSALKLDGAMKNVVINGKTFRDSISSEGGAKTWLTSDVLVNTLQQFTGDLTAAEIKAMGFKDSQVAGIMEMARTAMLAATEYKTLSDVVGGAKETAGSGWAKTWSLIFGDFEEAKTMWTGVAHTINGMIETSANARNKILGDWKALKGREALIQTVKNVWSALGSVLKPIKDAFREIFPATTGKQLYDMTVTLRDFTAKLKLGGETADRLKRTFAGVFAIFGIGWDILKEVGKTLAHLFGVITGGDGSVLEITASVGDFLVKLREAIHNGEGLKKFFEGLRKVLSLPIAMLQDFAGWLLKAFRSVDKSDFDGISKGLDKFGKRLSPLAHMGELMSAAWNKVGQVFKKVKNFLQPVLDKIPEFIGKIPEAISNGLSGLDYNKTLDGLNTGLLAALALIFTKFVNNGFKLDINGMFGFSSGTEGFLGTIKDSLDGLKDTMEAYQTSLKANTLLKIAGAIALLTASVVALSLIDSAKLTAATVAVGALFGELVGAFAAFSAVSGWSGTAKLPVLAAGLILLGIAINLMAIAVTKLSKLSWEELAKGLSGLVVILGALIATMKLMPDPKGMIKAGAGILLLSIAIKILASAVEDLSDLSWEEMARGLTGVAGLLAALTLFTKFSEANKGGLAQGAGLLLLAVAIKILASAMEDLGGLSWGEIGKGLVAMAGALQIMSWTLSAIPPTAPLGAAAVLIMAIALKQVADVLDQMGSMSWGEIGKAMTALLGALTIISAALYVIPPTAALGAAGVLLVAMSLEQIGNFLQRVSEFSWEEIGKAMTVLAGTLLIIATAMALMIVALPGAAATLVVAGALAILAPILDHFGQMSWEEIGKGLTMLAGVFAVLGVAGLLLIPVIPAILLLGVAVALLGVGMLAAGAGIFLFSLGLTALSVAGAAGAAALTAIVISMLNLLPLVAKKIGEAVIVFALVIAKAGPAITAAITTVLLAIIKAINTVAPKIIDTLFKLLTLMLAKLMDFIPKMVQAGLKILLGILGGIADNIYRIVTVAVRIITEFLRGIGDNISKITKAGADLIIKFVNSLADTIEDRSEEMGSAGGRLASAIIKGMVKGLSSGASEVASAAKEAAKSALNAAKNFLGINSPSKEFMKIGMGTNEGFALGINKFSHLVVRATESVGGDALSALGRTMSRLRDIVGGNVDVNPTITPVLDLSSVQKGAGRLAAMLSANPVSVSASYSRASDVANEYEDVQSARDGQGFANHTEMTFIQNNSSPKALSNADLYRQTNNQLSVAKGALTKKNA